MLKRYIFKSNILGQLAHWAVRLSSYVPNYIPEMLRAAEKYIVANPPGEVLVDEMYAYKPAELYNYIMVMCDTVPEIRQLNLRKEEIEAGFTVDGNRPRLNHVNYDTSSFVDLGALARNITNSIERESDWDEESDKRITKAIANV